MDYTIKELTDGNAVVVFADDSWANVSVMTNDTKATFEERVQGYAPKATVPNPSWIAAGQTGSVGQTSPVLPAASFSHGEDADNPAWLTQEKLHMDRWQVNLSLSRRTVWRLGRRK